jgi:hypothetical protein
MQSSCCYLVFLVLTAHWDPERVIWQGRLQRLCLVPGCTQPNVALLLGGQENWHRLWMDRRDDRVGRRGQDAVDLVRTRNRLGLRAAVSLNSIQMPAKQNSGRLSSSANQTTSFFLSLDSAWAHIRRNCSLAQGSGSPASTSRASAVTTCYGYW